MIGSYLGQYVGILLAAGRGRRFDPAGVQDKLLQPLPDGEPVATAAAKNLLAALPDVVAVVRPEAAVLAAQLRILGCDVSECPLADEGMGASLVHGIAQASDAAGWVIALADMPYVMPETITTLLDKMQAGADIAAPMFHGRRGNPVAFSRAHLNSLLELGGDQGARSLLAKFPVVEVEVDDEGIVLDIDSADDLDQPTQ
jgi:molybdenum cofactor cytidylyltransferase